MMAESGRDTGCYGPELVLMLVPPLCRFHKLIWGSFGNGNLEDTGVIAGGGDNGMITLYSVTHILSSGKEPVIAQRQKHTGAVRALDFNPFQVLDFILVRYSRNSSEWKHSLMTFSL